MFASSGFSAGLRLLVLSFLGAFLVWPLHGAERIYVGQLNPAQVQMFSYDPGGGTFAREDFDSADVDPATPLRSSQEFFGLNATDDTFVLAQPSISTAFGAIDAARRVQLPRPNTADAARKIVLDPSNDFAYLIGSADTQSQLLQVIDLRPTSALYLEPAAELAAGPGFVDRAVVGPDGDTLYLGLSRGGFGATGWYAKIVAVDIADPTAPSVLSETLVADPGYGHDPHIGGMRLATIDGKDYLFLMRYRMEILEITSPGNVSFVTSFESFTDFDPDPVGEDLRTRWHMDIHILDTAGGWRGVVTSGASVQPDFSFADRRNELVVVDLESLAGSSTVSELGALVLPTLGRCGVNSQETAPSLDGQTLYHLDACSTTDVGLLSAVDIDDLLAHVESAGPVPAVPGIALDDDPSLVTAYGIEQGLLVRDEIAPAAGGPTIESATVDGGMLLQNDAERTVDIVPVDGDSFVDVAHVFVGDRKVDAVVTADLIQATVPQWMPAGDRPVGVIDNTGMVSVYEGLRVVNPPEFLPSSVVYASGVANDIHQLNSSGEETAVESFSTVQGSGPVQVSGDGRRLYVGGFRDGRIASYCAVAEAGCDWNELDDELLLTGFHTDFALDDARGRLFVNTILGVAVIDITNHDLVSVDTDGDPMNGDTDLDFSGVFGTFPRSVALHPSGDYLYVAGSSQPFIYTVDLTTSPDVVDMGTEVSGTSVSGLDGVFGRADGLAVSADGTRLYFTQFSDLSVRVFDLSGAGGTLSELTAIPIPDATPDVRRLVLRPDDEVLYVTNRSRGVTDIFRLVADGSCPAPPCHVAVLDTGGGSNDVAIGPEGDYAYVSSDEGVVAIDVQEGSPTLNQILAVTGTGSGSLGAASSPGLAIEACDPCDPVAPSPGVQLDFAAIDSGGNTSVTSANVSSTPVNANFMVEGIPVFYDITTDASFSGTVQVCVDYDDSGLSAAQESNLKLLHEQADPSCDPPGSVCFVDVTSAGQPDTAANELCGEVTSFSQFFAAIDLATAPFNPTAEASQTPGTWQDATSLSTTWSGAAANPSGGALAGYSVSFTAAAPALPDQVIDVPHGADPHGAASGPLGEGRWYFNLRTCDVNGFCAAAVGIGPFGLDRSAPSWPIDPLSSSHSDVPQGEGTIDVAWQGAIDPFSGVAGYAWEITPSSEGWTCDQVIDGGADVLDTSVTVSAGEWTFHVCAVDTVGHWSAVTSLGPLAVASTCVTDPAACLFTDGFESGNLEAWTSHTP